MRAGAVDIHLLSGRYHVRRLDPSDVPEILSLCTKNTLYFAYCPPMVTEKSIIDDMSALPPGKTMSDKYYLGWYDGDRLIAVMDLIMAYPDQEAAWIGFFMTDVSVQNRGIGTGIIEDLCRRLAQLGVVRIQLAWVDGNPQAERFWHKNRFLETGASRAVDHYTLTVAQRIM